MNSFMTKRSGQDSFHTHVLLLKKSNLKGVFIRTNDAYIAICFSPSLPPLSSPTFLQSLPPFPPSYPLSYTQDSLFYHMSWNDFCEAAEMFTYLNESGA